MTINRESFERIVSEKSPLSPQQIDRIMGGEVTQENRKLAWEFFKLDDRNQMRVWSTARLFPDVELLRVGSVSRETLET